MRIQQDRLGVLGVFEVQLHSKHNFFQTSCPLSFISSLFLVHALFPWRSAERLFSFSHVLLVTGRPQNVGKASNFPAQRILLFLDGTTTSFMRPMWISCPYYIFFSFQPIPTNTLDGNHLTFRIRLHPQGNKESNKDFSFFQVGVHSTSHFTYFSSSLCTSRSP